MAKNDVECCLQTVSEAKSKWAGLPLSTKLDLLKELKARLVDHGVPLAHKAVAVKGLANSKEYVAMELVAHTVVITMYINRLIETYQELVRHSRCPQLPVRTVPSTGQLAVRVTPHSWSDRYQMIVPGVEVELYLQPGAEATQGSVLLGKEKHNGRLCVVLGAGNQSFLGLKDMLFCLFERNEAVVYKPHPIQEGSVDLFEAVLKPVVEVGACRIVTCDLPGTKQLVYHPLVDALHMTGGIGTHDAIAWGATPEEQLKRKAANDPLLKVPFSSELGCVTPFLVAPGKWSPAELQLHARQVASAAANNAGCNCVAAKVLLLADDWEQKDEFVAELKKAIKEHPMQPCYYPGIFSRYDAWREHYPDAEAVSGPEEPSSIPVERYLPVLLKEMDELPQDPDSEYAFKVEPFAPTLVILKLKAKGIEDYLEKAVAFCNEQLWGDLTCTLLVHPATEAAHKEAVGTAIAQLKYGVVSVNAWAVVAFAIGTSTWGGWNDPSKTLANVQSGLGVVGNPYLYDHVQKSVVKVPFAGMGVPQPVHVQPLPMGVAKAMAGYVCNGFLGMYHALMAKA